MAIKKKSTNKLGKELKSLVDETQKKAKEQTKETIPKSESSLTKVRNIKWDVKKDDIIEFFDSNLSYELTGYRPINGIKSLDFDPSWFTETRETWNRTGHYTEFRPGSKAFRDFWLELYRRCKYGMVVNGYTITGDHYFFLNFYRLKDLVNVTEAGGGRSDIFPDFFVCQYEWFHYLKLAKMLRMNALMMKAREIEACLPLL